MTQNITEDEEANMSCGICPKKKIRDKKARKIAEKKIILSIENAKQSIYKNWEKEWCKDKHCDIDNDCFFELFKRNYEFVSFKVEYNKNENFKYKKIFIRALRWLPAIFVIIFCLKLAVEIYPILKNTGLQSGFWIQSINVIVEMLNLESVASYAFIIVITAWFEHAVIKWLDIKKYQETWVRHQKHKYAVEIEMLKYIYGLEPYYGSGRNEKFMNNIIKIWDDNELKFEKNMEEKEAKLTDVLDSLKEKI